MTYKEKATKLFHEGYNCSQAVFAAFADKMKIDEKTALRLSSSFGGGFARLREVCGAVSGMMMVIGMLYGYDSMEDKSVKGEHYKVCQGLISEFKNELGSIICRELIDSDDKSPTPADRTKEYYKKRPCAEIVAVAVDITERYINFREKN